MMWLPEERMTGSNVNFRNAFTVIELLVVMAIIAIIATISIPAVRSISKNNDENQAGNIVRSMVSSARAIAIAQHRMAGVVFFEETANYSRPVNSSQTAMQIFVEDFNPPAAANGVTVFVYYSTARQYLPNGIKLATLSDNMVAGGSGINMAENNNASVNRTRAILFDSNGQLVTRFGLATYDPGPGGSNQGQYPTAFGDWRFLTPAGRFPDGLGIPFRPHPRLPFSFTTRPTWTPRTSPMTQRGPTGCAATQASSWSMRTPAP